MSWTGTADPVNEGGRHEPGRAGAGGPAGSGGPGAGAEHGPGRPLLLQVRHPARDPAGVGAKSEFFRGGMGGGGGPRAHAHGPGGARVGSRQYAGVARATASRRESNRARHPRTGVQEGHQPHRRALHAGPGCASPPHRHPMIDATHHGQAFSLHRTSSRIRGCRAAPGHRGSARPDPRPVESRVLVSARARTDPRTPGSPGGGSCQPASMHGDSSVSRRSPASRSTNSGSALMLPVPNCVPDGSSTSRDRSSRSDWTRSARSGSSRARG